MIADVDFWPSVELLPLLRLQLTAWGERKRAVVVPNFQRSGHGCRAKGPYACREALSRGELSIPSTYTELAACAREHMCSVFDSEYNAAGQASTDVHAWRGLTAGAKMPVRCITSTRYEPFVVLRHSEETPKFDERFYGYGKNKVRASHALGPQRDRSQTRDAPAPRRNSWLGKLSADHSAVDSCPCHIGPARRPLTHGRLRFRSARQGLLVPLPPPAIRCEADVVALERSCSHGPSLSTICAGDERQVCRR